MNKQETILWCKVNLNQWPSGVHQYPSPSNWDWTIRQNPYVIPEILLQTVTDEGDVITITKADVK